MTDLLIEQAAGSVPPNTYDFVVKNTGVLPAVLWEVAFRPLNADGSLDNSSQGLQIRTPDFVGYVPGGLLQPAETRAISVVTGGTGLDAGTYTEFVVVDFQELCDARPQ